MLLSSFAEVSTVPVYVSYVGVVILSVMAFFMLAAGLFLLWGTFSGESGLLGGGILLTIVGIAFAVLAFFSAGTEIDGKRTVDEVKEAFSVTFSTVDTVSFSNSDKQVVTSLVDVRTDDNLYEKGALVSRDGDVALYIYEKGSNDPVAVMLPQNEFFQP